MTIQRVSSSSDGEQPEESNASDAASTRMAHHESLRALPSVDELVRSVRPLLARMELAELPPTTLAHYARSTLTQARATIRSGKPAPHMNQLLTAVIEAAITATRPHLRPLINATGVVINTNLGRAPLSAAAVAAVAAVARSYSNLEYDLAAGQRGSRQQHVAALLGELAGAESALVVNNNAAAVLVVLSALAAGREVLISRGELVEIGGGFRIPDVMRQSGARLVEVGTTNRTRARDFQEALTPDTAALLSVHPSNFRIVGFTETPSLAELADLAHQHDLPLIHDLGSGSLVATENFGLAHEPTPQESIAAGADVICFSGDKLLGGPQAGIIIGRAAHLSQIEHHPLMRAVRIDKLTLAALEATLLTYRAGRAEQEIPVIRALASQREALYARAERWAQTLRAWGIPAQVVEGDSAVGGGSLPGETQPTALCSISSSWDRDTTGHPTMAAPARPLPEVGTLAAALRHCEPPVITRVFHDHLLLDPRTVLPDQDEPLLDAIHSLIERR